MTMGRSRGLPSTGRPCRSSWPTSTPAGSRACPGLSRPSSLVLIPRLGADIVVVYKVDRLTRSLADFAKLIELFEAHNVSFVSVTQSFNTSSSMGHGVGTKKLCAAG